jgi:hypothetical protein
MASRFRRLLVFAVASWAAMEGEARAAGFFGPETATAWQPELDGYVQVADGVRLQAQVLAFLVPSEGAAQLGVGVYASWLLADVLRAVLSPDRAKTHALDLRLGVIHDATLAPGGLGGGSSWTLQFEVTPRLDLARILQVSLRNRAAVSWPSTGGAGSTFRYRGRLQLEREFDVEHTWITPFVNAELFWQQAPGMWTQLRLQGGLQVGFDLFARGQSVEVSWMAVTRLQPVHTWNPQVGLILSSYF